MPAYYGKVNGSVFITSHAQLVADLCNLNTAKNITEYMNAPFFKIGITQLCGIDSPFSALKMLSANTFLEVNKMIVSRFYPKRELKEADSDTLKHISNILKNSLLLCSKKWNCSISLTGGVDSKMTLAAANGLYDKFHYFSFISSDAERKDAEAAHDICENIGVDHDIYLIPENEMEIPKFDNYSAIIQHNQSYLRNKSGNDVRKRIWLAQNTDIDIEIKSHASEVGRAFYYKKLERKKFKYPLTVRDMSNLAKRNLFDRKILVDMDLSFQRFKDVSDFGNFPKGYDETDMFYWENRMPAWGSLVKQSFDLSHETTILYNNRRLLELFMSFPLEERINDTNQHLLIQKMNNKIHDLNILVNNSMKNKSRILLEKIFFSINK